MKLLIEDLKEEEGFRGEVYKDHLGFDTIGYGTKLPLNPKEAELLLRLRFKKKKSNLIKSLTKTYGESFFSSLSLKEKEVLFSMAYQLGVRGVLKFKNMLKALKLRDIDKASFEMKNSKWYTQTPNRVERLIKRLKSV